MKRTDTVQSDRGRAIARQVDRARGSVYANNFAVRPNQFGNEEADVPSPTPHVEYRHPRADTGLSEKRAARDRRNQTGLDCKPRQLLI